MPATKQPIILPKPPRATATKANNAKCTPTSGKIKKKLDIIAPAMLTHDKPNAQPIANILFELMPNVSAALRSCAVACKASPVSDLFTNKYNNKNDNKHTRLA